MQDKNGIFRNTILQSNLHLCWLDIDWNHNAVAAF